jgi:hypothetical protein
MKRFETGASSSELKPRYDLIPLEALESVATRFALGATVHGDHNYQKGGDDFWQDRKNHLVEHLFKYIHGDTSDDHLGAVLCNAAMLAWKESNDRP